MSTNTMTRKKIGSPAKSGGNRDEVHRIVNLSTPIEPESYVELRREEVARRALRLWRAAGGPTGRDLEYWLQAEVELLSDRLGRRPSRVPLAEAA